MTTRANAGQIGYMPAGAGAVARTVQTELREQVKVTQFAGVDPTGVSDSTVGIQNAINYVGLTGGILSFPQGTYKISDVLNVPNANVYIKGEGRNATRFLQTNHTKDTFNITGHYFTIQSLSVVYASQGNAGFTAFDLNGAFYSCISDVYVHRSGVGFRYRNSANSNQLNNFVVEDATTVGVFCLGTTANVIASNFQILNGNSSLCSDGCIRLEGGVEGCNFVNGHTYGGAVSLMTSGVSLAPGASALYNKFHAVYFDNAGTGGILNNTGELDFIDCWWSSRPGNGVYIANVDGVRFTGGGAFNCAQKGALVETTATRVVFSNWMCRANSTEAVNAHDGMVFAGTQNFSVLGCTVTNDSVSLGGVQRYGIAVTAQCDKFVIRDCHLHGNGTGALSDSTSDTATDKTIAGNIGYRTSNNGAAEIASGATSAVVNHGLGVVPNHQDIMLTRGVTNAGSVDLYVDSTSISATQFTIRTAPAPTADIDILWSARCKGA